MILYLLKRIFWLVPTLLVVTMITFFLSYQQQGSSITSDCLYLGATNVQPTYFEECVRAEKKRKGLDKAPFILSIHPLSEPDTLYLFTDPLEKQAIRSLCFTYGNWEAIETFRQSVFLFIVQQSDAMNSIMDKDPKLTFTFQDLREVSAGLLRESEPSNIQRSLTSIKQIVSELPDSDLLSSFSKVEGAWKSVRSGSSRWKTFFPTVSWHGVNTQYADWLSAVIFRFEFGKNDANRDVIRTIGSLLPNTLLFTGLGILFAFLISVPFAIWSARNAGSKREKATGLGLLMLDSVPSFWLALMLLIIFADPESLDWFPSSYQPYAATSTRLWSMVLPLITFTYGSLAFLTRSLRSSLLEIYQQPFIKAAGAQGYSERQILVRHALRPALLPIITVLGTVFPVLVSGSVILEGLFNINGLGYTILKSTLSNDQNVILAIFTLSAIMTLVGYFVADILYGLADPRIRVTSGTSE